MKIAIHLRKDNNESNPELTAKFGDHKHDTKVKNISEVITLSDIDHRSDNKLVIERNDCELYNTKQDHHSNKIYIDKIVVDEFWQFDKDFYPPVTVFNPEYRRHIAEVGSADWIKNSIEYNTDLYFNGRLEWKVKYPVRRCFFKDIER